MSIIEEETFLDKIKAKRRYADRQSTSESDSSQGGKIVKSLSQPYTGVSVKAHVQTFTDMMRGYSRSDSSFTQMQNDTTIESTDENDHLSSTDDNYTTNGPSNHSQSNDTSFAEMKLQNVPSGMSKLPCDIFYIDSNEVIKRFNNFDEISEYLVEASVNEREDRTTPKFDKLTKVPLRMVDHYVTIGMYLKRLYEHDFLMDVVIDVRGQQFYAHRVALCCHSDYFAELFHNSNGKRIPFEVKINGVSAEAFATFLEFCYTGELNIYPEIAGDILIVADYLKVRALKARCDLIIKNLPVEQVLKIMTKTHMNTNHRLYSSLYKNVLENFSEASKMDLFLQFDVDIFCKMIESDDINASSEYEIFTVAVRWIINNVEERVKHSTRIMSNIRFAQMSQEELFMCAETTSLVRGYDKFREMILIANWILTTANTGRSDSFDFPRPAARKCFSKNKKSYTKVDDTPTTPKMVMPPPVMTSTPRYEKPSSPAESHSATDIHAADESPEPEATQNDDVTQIVAETQALIRGQALAQAQADTDFVDILVVGGFQAEQTFTPTDVEKYDVEDNQWLHFCGLPSPRRHHSVVATGEHIYMIGGCEPYDKITIPEPSNTVYRMSMTSKQWIPVASMMYDRYCHGSCTVDGIIFAIGGKSKYIVLDSMECYDPSTDSWVLSSSLPEPLYDSAVASLKSKIFVVGGLTNNEMSSVSHVVDSVYCFDTNTESWTKFNNLRFGRCQARLVNVNDRLYLCGGATNTYTVHNSELASTSNIDEYDSDNDTWTHVSDMVIPRHDMGVAVAGSRIYIIGGITTPADRVLQSIECYDTVSQAWIPGVQDLPYPARWICCCSVTSAYQKPSTSADV